MKIVDQSVELWPIPVNAEETLRHIERAGRVCYKSEDKITDTSAEKFIQNIVERGHESVLEHGNVILSCNKKMYKSFRQYQKDENKCGRAVYLRFTCAHDNKNGATRYIVSGNIRAWRACMRYFINWSCLRFNWMTRLMCSHHWAFFDLEHKLNDETVLDESRNGFVISVNDLQTTGEYLTHMCITQTAVVDRGITHELVRHRPASFSQESTRYCNYAKGKFDSEIAVIDPGFPNMETGRIWEDACLAAERAYNELISCGIKPQTARSVLPTCLKAELVITTNLRELFHMIRLRGSEGAHPQAREWAGTTRRLLKETYPELDMNLLEGWAERGG